MMKYFYISNQRRATYIYNSTTTSLKLSIDRQALNVCLPMLGFLESLM